MSSRSLAADRFASDAVHASWPSCASQRATSRGSGNNRRRSSVSVLYRYFTSKDDVFAEILRNVQREILLKTSSHGRSTGGLDVHAGNRAFLEYCAENPGLMRAYHQSESVSPQFRIAATRVRRAITRRTLATLERNERLASTYDPDRVMLQVTSLICTETIGLSAFALEEEPLASCTIDQLTEIADGLWLGSLSELIPGLLD